MNRERDWKLGEQSGQPERRIGRVLKAMVLGRRRRVTLVVLSEGRARECALMTEYWIMAGGGCLEPESSHE